MEPDLKKSAEAAPRLYTDTRDVRFQEVDAAGIVFYARIFDYFHDAYVGFLRERGAPLERALRYGEWVAPLTRAEAEYLRPLRFGDRIDVSVVAVRLEETEYAIDYRVDLDGEPACVGRTRHVSVDPETFRRVGVPEGLRESLSGGG